MLRLNLIFLFSLLVFQLSGQVSETLQIYSGYNYDNPMTFCFKPEQIAPNALIKGTTVPNEFKISITNYKKGQDTLFYAGADRGISVRWDNNGSLILSGVSTLAEYQAAIREVYYNNYSKNPTEGLKNITITLTDADYLPATQHFYQFVQQRGITWSSAKTVAESMKLYGLQGYLATITSKVENDFIWTKTKGTGWIGASDADKSDEWKWVTGPEKDLLFWRGKGASGSAVNGAYSNWNTGEPNDSGGEYYAHITYGVGTPSSWNDLNNTGNLNASNVYHPQGYLVEYGGMEAVGSLRLSDYVDINIVNFKFSEKLESTICQFDTVTLNHNFQGNYVWTPAVGLSSANISNPVASPMQTTVYTVDATIGTCVLTEQFTVNVKPAPIVKIVGDTDICEGSVAGLEAIPETSGTNYSYGWDTGETTTKINVQDENWYTVLTDNGECTFRDSMYVNVHEYPVYSLNQSDTLICGLPMQGQLQITTTDTDLVWTAEDQTMTIATPLQKLTSMNVPAYGKYRVYVDLTNQYGCHVSDTLDIGFHQVPTSTFAIDSTECYHYNLKVNYTGNATGNALYNWMFIDTLSEIGLTDVNISLGINDKTSRYLRLQVIEDGCLSTISEEYIKVIPNMTVWADTTANCEPFIANFYNETTEPIDFYEWDFGDGGKSVESFPVHTYANDGSYDVSLKIVSDEGCENIAVLKDFITVYPIPTAELDLKPDSCYGDTLSINYIGTASPVASYYWDLSALNPGEILENPGTVFGPVKLSLTDKPNSRVGFYVISEYNCKSDEIEVPFKRKPWVYVDADPYEGCPVLDVNFTLHPKENIDELNYKWNFGNAKWEAGDAELNHLFAAPDSSFTVLVAIQSEITGCMDTIRVPRDIQVYPIPHADFIPDSSEVSIVHPVITFNNLSLDAIQYFWDFGDTLGVSFEESPTYTYEKLGYFNVRLIAENELTCRDSAFHEILVRFEKIFPPTAFSPNSTIEENRSFLLTADGVKKEGYHLQIFNRWGQLIFESENEYKAWDGKMDNGQSAPAGAYIWVLNYVDFLGKSHRQNGTVSLLY